MGGPQIVAQLVAAAIRPARWYPFERSLLSGFDEGGPGEDQETVPALRVGMADVDGPDFAVVVEEDETKWHRRGSAMEPSERGSQDA